MELKFFFRNFVNKSWIGETVTDRQIEEIDRKQKWKSKSERGREKDRGEIDIESKEMVEKR